jgi:ribosomal protein L31
MKRFIITIILALTLFLSILPITIADDTITNADTSNFLYIIDGTHLLSISPDVVTNSKNIFILHDYTSLKIDYRYENGSIIQMSTVKKTVIKLDIYDNTHLILTDSENNVILDMHIHAMTIENFFKYVFPLQYQQLALSVVLAFISAIILIYAFYIKKETKIL